MHTMTTATLALLLLLVGAASASAHDWHAEPGVPHVHREPDGHAQGVEAPAGAGFGTARGHVLPDEAVAIGVLTLLAAGALLLVRRATPSRAAVALLATVGPLGVVALALAADDEHPAPAIQKHFEPFKDRLELRHDDTWLYVGSSGLPDHPMMVGIRSWQQQVPLPQPYTGGNAWQIPLHPRLAEKPISGKTSLYRGAIALAVNGVPIFNALNNRGEDAYLAGELDEYGGHCGRGDDYHYHVAPLHLEKVVGKGNPIGYALDGFPLYGATDANGKEPKDLDELNGRMEKDGYRYYSTKTFPYVNGGMRGVVAIRGDAIAPQPQAAPIRPAGRPLRGARITAFVRDDVKKVYALTYVLEGKSCSVRYTIDADGAYVFTFMDGEGKETTETYHRREGGGGPPSGMDVDPPGMDGRPPGMGDGAPGMGEPARRTSEPRPPMPATAATLKVTSPAFEPGGKIPVEYTGDGEGVSPPLAWTAGPPGTKSYALELWHKPHPDGDEVKSYWVIVDIPENVRSLPRNAKGIGRAGTNDKGRTDYDPMRSKGPGVKEYHVTVYALSAQPKFASERVTGAELLTAIQAITLATGTLSYTYERGGR